MTGNELATIEPETAEPHARLSRSRAEVLDGLIRDVSIQVADNAATLFDYLEEAMLGQIHLALGYETWKAYVVGVVNITPVDAAERKALVSLMSGKGLSLRQMEAILGAGKSTLARDRQEIEGAPKERPKPKPKQDIIDAEVIEEPIKVPPVSRDFKEEMWNLANVVSALIDILEDDRFPRARETIANNYGPGFQEHIDSLARMCDELMGD